MSHFTHYSERQARLQHRRNRVDDSADSGQGDLLRGITDQGSQETTDRYASLVRERLKFWGRVLLLGTRQVNTAGGWAGTIILALGIVGIVVPLVFHLSHWLIAVILVGLLVAVTAEGGYQVWHESDQARKAEQDAARRDGDRDARNRSVAAAGKLAILVAKLDGSVAAWEKGSQNSVSSELKAAYDDFAATEAGVEGELADEELSRRVRLHSELTNALLTAVGEAPEYRPQVAKVLHEHAVSISRALQARQRGTDLPAYVAPPIKAPVDLEALFAWRSSPPASSLVVDS